MKVVLFCGGLGTRLREHSDTIPKPLVHIGSRPILWHLMKYYAHYGHRDFILCLGYGGDLIRKFFLNFDPRDGADFVMDRGVAEVRTEGSDVPDWRIHLVDTGLESNIGERLMRVRALVDGEEMFLANYSDQLSDLPLDDYLAWFSARNAIAGFTAVKPSQSFHLVTMRESGHVEALRPVDETETWINGGYLVLRPEIFDYVKEGDELVGPPFGRLVERQKLVAYRYRGFWKAMDTLKDKIAYDRLDASGARPWMVWRK